MALGDVIARLSVSLSLDAKEFASGRSNIQRDIGSLQDSFKALGDKWMETGKRLSVGVTAPLAAFGIMSAKTASDAQELDSAFSETFGNLTGEMRAWAVETGDAMGRSTQAMQEMANTFGIFFNQAAPTRKEAAEMSKTFTTLAQDLSSFYNVSGDEALQKLRSGLSGESEPLRDFGVFLTEATVKAKAMEMGLTGVGDELTEQEKILARYQLILESTTNAQGDVARTSGGAANQWRSFTEALEELQVVIGQKLLPILTPLINGMTKIVNGFNNLPSGVQTAIVAVGAMMAAIGPMMLVMGTLAATVLPLFAAKFGVIGIAISAFVNPLGTAISFLSSFLIQLGGMTILKTVAGLFLRLAGPVGLLASAGLLIYNNWDRIAPIFQEFWEAAKQALGPPIQELLATIQGLFNELWSGPLGTGIKGAMAIVTEFGAILASTFGQAILGALRSFLNVIVGVLKSVGDAIRIVNALLNGDWQAAWNAAASIAMRIVGPFTEVATSVVRLMRQMYVGVKTWLLDKLSAVFDGVKKKIEMVEGAFHWMWDKVVGNSWVPDMVDAIGDHMGRLDKVMVDPAQQATRSVSDAMRDMARETSAILDRLFPEVRKAMEYQRELAVLRGAGLAPAALEAAERRLGMENIGAHTGPIPIAANDTGSIVGDVGKSIEAMEKRLGLAVDRTKEQTVRVAKSFKDMADDTMGALQRMTSAIKGGGFLDILEGIIGLGMQLGSIGVFGKQIATNLNKSVPGYANGTNFHPGGLAMVGERGPELVNLPRGSKVWPNGEGPGGGRGGNTYHFSGNLMTPEFWAQIQAGDMAAAQGGATLGRAQMMRSQTRRLA